MLYTVILQHVPVGVDEYAAPEGTYNRRVVVEAPEQHFPSEETLYALAKQALITELIVEAMAAKPRVVSFEFGGDRRS